MRAEWGYNGLMSRLLVLLVKEMRFRPAAFAIGLTAVAVAAGSLVGLRAMLAAHDAETDRRAAALQARAESRLEGMRDDARIFAKQLGYNVLLLPAEADSAAFLAEDRSTHFFTTAQARALAASAPYTLNHLLPVLRERVRWNEFGGDVVLVGIEGEIYIKAGEGQAPIATGAAPGEAHLGAAVAARLGIKPGATVNLLGENFKVRRVLASQGDRDDVSVLLNLADAQRLLKHPDQVSGIMGLSCNCAAGDVEQIRRAVVGALPGAQVVSFTSRAEARERARQKIGAATRAESEDLHASRIALRKQLEHFAFLLAILTMAVAGLLVGALAASDARERRGEAAVLRALGVSPGRVLGLLLAKWALLGAAGGVLGASAGLALTAWRGGVQGVPPAWLALSVLLPATVAVLAAAGFACVTAWRDPALILNQE